MQKPKRGMHQHRRLQARGLTGIVCFLVLSGATGTSLSTQRPQVGFNPLTPTLAATASQGGFPQAGIGGVPSEVEQLTVALDGWGET